MSLHPPIKEHRRRYSPSTGLASLNPDCPYACAGHLHSKSVGAQHRFQTILHRIKNLLFYNNSRKFVDGIKVVLTFTFAICHGRNRVCRCKDTINFPLLKFMLSAAVPYKRNGREPDFPRGSGSPAILYEKGMRPVLRSVGRGIPEEHNTRGPRPSWCSAAESTDARRAW